MFAFCPANCNLGQVRSLLNMMNTYHCGIPKDHPKILCVLWEKTFVSVLKTTKKMKKSVETLEAAEKVLRGWG